MVYTKNVVALFSDSNKQRHSGDPESTGEEVKHDGTIVWGVEGVREDGIRNKKKLTCGTPHEIKHSLVLYQISIEAHRNDQEGF